MNNISIFLIDAALSGDELAQKQLSDVLEENSLKRYPKFKLLWEDISIEYSRCYFLSILITIYRISEYSLPEEDRGKWTTHSFNQKIFNSREELKEFLEYRLEEEIGKYFVRE
jgi:hypothetical protein